MRNLVPFITLFLLHFIFSSCRKDVLLASPCILEKVTQMNANVCGPPVLKLYKFEGEPVYVVDHNGCVDGLSEVYDDHCNYLGAIGGIGGLNTIQGKSFSSAVYIRTVPVK